MRFCLPLALAISLAADAQQKPPDLKPTATMLGQEFFVKSGSTGMVLVIVRGNETYLQGFGETAVGSGKAPDANSLLRLCSLSKIFATDLLIKLAGDKLLRLDDPLQNFAPAKVKVPGSSKRPIELADLATHTSGLPREAARRPHDTPRFTFPDYKYRWHWLPAQHLKIVPGTAAAYSNVGYDLLGDALERAAGRPYAALLAERTTRPLAMHETGFTPTDAQCARLLQGAHDEGPCTDTQQSAGSSGLYSTGTDMLVWLKYLLGAAAPAIPAQNPAAQAVYLLPESLAGEKGLDHAGTPTGIGLGWMHLLAPEDPSAIVEKTGGGAGFLTYIALNPAHHTGIFVAVTDGTIETHLNVFRESNNLLLALNGLPPLPPEVKVVPAKPRTQSPRGKKRRSHKSR